MSRFDFPREEISDCLNDERDSRSGGVISEASVDRLFGREVDRRRGRLGFFSDVKVRSPERPVK